MSGEKRNSLGCVERGVGGSGWAEKDRVKGAVGHGSRKSSSAEPSLSTPTSSLSDTASVGSGEGKKKSKFSFWSNLFKSKIPEQNEEAGFESSSSFESDNSIATTNSFSFVSPQKRRGKGGKDKKNLADDAEKQSSKGSKPRTTVGNSNSRASTTLNRIGLRIGFKKKYNLQSCESLEHIGPTGSIPKRHMQGRSPNPHFHIRSDLQFHLSRSHIPQGGTPLADLPLQRTGDFPRIHYNSPTTVINPGPDTQDLLRSDPIEPQEVSSGGGDSPADWGSSTQRKRRAPLPPSNPGPSSAMLSPVLLPPDQDPPGSTNVELKSVRKLADVDDRREGGGEGRSALILRGRTQSGGLTNGQRPCSCNVNSIFARHSRYNQLTRRGGGSCESSSCIYGTGSRLRGPHVKGKKKAPAPPNPFGNPDVPLDDEYKTDGDIPQVEIGIPQQLRRGGGEQENNDGCSEGSSGRTDLKRGPCPDSKEGGEVSADSTRPGPPTPLHPPPQPKPNDAEKKEGAVVQGRRSSTGRVLSNGPNGLSIESRSNPPEIIQRDSPTPSSRTTQDSAEESTSGVVSVPAEAAAGSKIKNADSKTSGSRWIKLGQSRLSTSEWKRGRGGPTNSAAAAGSPNSTVPATSAKTPGTKTEMELLHTSSGRNVAEGAPVDSVEGEEEDREAEISQNLLNDRTEQELLSSRNGLSFHFPPSRDSSQNEGCPVRSVADEGRTRKAPTPNNLYTFPTNPKLFSKFRPSEGSERGSSPGPSPNNTPHKPLNSDPVKGIGKPGESNAQETKNMKQVSNISRSNINEPKVELIKSKKESDKSLMLFFTGIKGAKKTGSSCITSGGRCTSSGSSTGPSGVDPASPQLSPDPSSSPERSDPSSPQPMVTPRPWYKRSITKDKHIPPSGSGSSTSGSSVGVTGSSSKQESKLSPKSQITMTRFSDLDREAHRIVEENKRKSAEVQFNKNARELIVMFNESFGPIPDEDGVPEVLPGISNPSTSSSTPAQPSSPPNPSPPFPSPYSNKYAKPVGSNPTSNFPITKPLTPNPSNYDDHKKLAVVQPQSKQPLVTPTSSGTSTPPLSNPITSPLTSEAGSSNIEGQRRSYTSPTPPTTISSGVNPLESSAVLWTSSSTSSYPSTTTPVTSMSTPSTVSRTESPIPRPPPAIQPNNQANPPPSTNNSGLSVGTSRSSSSSSEGDCRGPGDGDWTCPRCTLTNTSWTALCEACFLRKDPKPVSSTTSPFFERVSRNKPAGPLPASDRETNSGTPCCKTGEEEADRESNNNNTSAKPTQSVHPKTSVGVPPSDYFLGSSNPQSNGGEIAESIQGPAQPMTSSPPGDTEVEEIDIKKIRQARLAFFTTQKLNNLGSTEEEPRRTCTLFNDGDDDFIDSLLKLQKSPSGPASLPFPSVEMGSSEEVEDGSEYGYNIDPQGELPQSQYPDFSQLVPGGGWMPPAGGSLPFFRGFRPQLESITEADSNYYTSLEFTQLYENWELTDQPRFQPDPRRDWTTPSPTIKPPPSPTSSPSPVIWTAQGQYGPPKIFPCRVSQQGRPTNPLRWTRGSGPGTDSPRNPLYLLPKEEMVLLEWDSPVGSSRARSNVDEEVGGVITGYTRGSCQEAETGEDDGSNYRPFNNPPPPPPLPLIHSSDPTTSIFYAGSSHISNIPTSPPPTPDREGSPLVRSMDRWGQRNPPFPTPSSTINHNNSQRLGRTAPGRELSVEEYRRLGAIPKGYQQLGQQYPQHLAQQYPQHLGQYSSGESVAGERRWRSNCSSGESLESSRRRGQAPSSLLPQPSNPYEEGSSGEGDEYGSAENSLPVGNLVRKLEWAIGHGEHRLAATLAHDLALLQKNSALPKHNRQPFRIRVYVEDRFMQQGPFFIEVRESMILRDLKYKIESDWGIPSGFQKWILGKRIAEADEEFLGSYEVTDNSMAFLYLVTPQIGQMRREEEEIYYKSKEPTPPPLPSKPKPSSPNPMSRFSPVSNKPNNELPQPVLDQHKIINSVNTKERTKTPTLEGCDKPTRVPTHLNISLYQKPSPPKGGDTGLKTILQPQAHNDNNEKWDFSQPDHPTSPTLESPPSSAIDPNLTKDKPLPPTSPVAKGPPKEGPVVSGGAPQERPRLGSDANKGVPLPAKSDLGPCTTSTNGIKLFDKPGTPNNLNSSLSLQQKLASLRQAAEQAFGKSFGQPVQRLGDTQIRPNSNKTTTVTVKKVDPGPSKSVKGQGQENLKGQTTSLNGANINGNTPSVSTKKVHSVSTAYPSSSSSNASSTVSTGSPKRSENILEVNGGRKADPVGAERGSSLQVKLSEGRDSSGLEVVETKRKALSTGPTNNTSPSSSTPVHTSNLSQPHVFSSSNSNGLLKPDIAGQPNVTNGPNPSTESHPPNLTAPHPNLQPSKKLSASALAEKHTQSLPETSATRVVSNGIETRVGVRISEPVAKPRTKKALHPPAQQPPEIVKEFQGSDNLNCKDSGKSVLPCTPTSHPTQPEVSPGSAEATTPTSPNQLSPSPKGALGVDGSCQTTLPFPVKPRITRPDTSNEPLPAQSTTNLSPTPSGPIGPLQSLSLERPLDPPGSPSPTSPTLTGLDRGPVVSQDNPKRTLSPAKSPVPSSQSPQLNPFPQASTKSSAPPKGIISGVISQSPTPLLRSSPAELVEFPAAVVKIADSSLLGNQLRPAVVRSSPVVLTSTSPPKTPAQFLPSLERNSDTSKAKVVPFRMNNSDSSVINTVITPGVTPTPEGTIGTNRTDELKEDKVETYLRMLELMEHQDVIATTDEIDCPVCFLPIPAGRGVTLRDCLHSFCKECLTGAVEYAEESEVKCPFRDNTYSCNSSLQEREIKALVPSEIFENYLTRSVKLAERKMMNTFHCKTVDCPGWCIFEDDVNYFLCPVCSSRNCITCAAIHASIDCQQYQRELAIAAETDQNAKSSRLMLEKMIQRGEALDCPACHVVLLKKWGCDWVRCTYCKTEICWVTKGFRWGPGGKGDNSGGCKCGVNGVRCHPKCTYCH